MTGPADVRDRITLQLQTIAGLHVFDSVPDGVSRTPCAMLGVPQGGQQETLDGGTTWKFPVRLVVSKWDGPRAQRLLDAYLAPTGDYSLKQTIERAGGDVFVSGIQQYGKVQMGGVDYAAAELIAEVLS